MKNTRFTGIFLLFLLFINACGQEQHESSSELNYIAWPTASVKILGITDARNPAIKICLTGSVNPADLQKAKDWAVQSALAWQRALVIIDKTVTAKVQLSCDKPTVSVRLLNGNGRSFANGRSVSLYVREGYGTWTHELGHAFAALGDTYSGGTAGACQSGQPQSLMCWGAFGPRKDPKVWSTLWPDDIAGVHTTYRRIVPTSEAPEWAATLNPETTFDVTAPWPGAEVNTDSKYTETDLDVSSSVARLGSSPSTLAL